MAINIELLRRTQASIMDRSKPFDMSNWSSCICGHLVEACGLGRVSMYGDHPNEVMRLSVRTAGLSDRECEDLFYVFFPWERSDRIAACRKLDALIKDREKQLARQTLYFSRLPWDSATRSALEPAASAALARAEEATEAAKAPVEEEELELVGV